MNRKRSYGRPSPRKKGEELVEPLITGEYHSNPAGVVILFMAAFFPTIATTPQGRFVTAPSSGGVFNVLQPAEEKPW